MSPNFPRSYGLQETRGGSQRRIVAYLDDETAKIDRLIAETERLIELARERRAALITAAVTGQIDVREMV
jgi:type I restriction enzyme S subunit